MEDYNKIIVIDFFIQLLELYEFEINLDDKDYFKLKDLQGGNLGNIESEKFETLEDILIRLDSYHNDYIYRSLKEREHEVIKKDDYDLIASRFIESNLVHSILFDVTLEKYKNIKNQLPSFDKKEILNFFDKEEKNFKKICEKYSNNIIPNGMIFDTMCYEDFVNFYKEPSISIHEKCIENVFNVFVYHDIIDVKEYGSDSDEGLLHLSSLYEEILNALEITYKDIYTEDGVSDGKYVTTITFKDNSKLEIDTSAWNGIKVVSDNVESIFLEYEKIKNVPTNEIENEICY